LYENLKRRT